MRSKLQGNTHETKAPTNICCLASCFKIVSWFFYFRHLKANGSWPDNKPAISCVNYKIKEYPEVHVDLRGALQTVHTREAGVSEPFYDIRENGESHTPLVLRLLHIKFDGSASRDEKIAGYWRHTSIGYEMALNGTSLTEHVAQKRYRVVTVVVRMSYLNFTSFRNPFNWPLFVSTATAICIQEPELWTGEKTASILLLWLFH